MIKEIDKENDVEIAFAGMVHREGHDCKDMIDDTNKKLKSYCPSIGRRFINNANIDDSCFNRSKLHLNRKGSSLLAKNTVSYVKLKACWYLECRDGVFIDAENNSSETLINIFKLENLQKCHIL